MACKGIVTSPNNEYEDGETTGKTIEGDIPDAEWRTQKFNQAVENREKECGCQHQESAHSCGGVEEGTGFSSRLQIHGRGTSGSLCLRSSPKTAHERKLLASVISQSFLNLMNPPCSRFCKDSCMTSNSTPR